MNAVGVELRSPQSALHGHRVRLLGVTEGVSATGDEAWIARIRDTTEGEDFCVRVWIQSAVLGTTQHVEFGRCGSRVPSLRPTVTTQSSIG